MIPLSHLLRRALARVNSLGTPFALGVLSIGIVLIALQGLVTFQIGVGITRQLPAIVGQERYADIEKQFSSGELEQTDLAQMAELIGTEVSTTLEQLPEEQRSQYLLTLGMNVLRSAGPWVLVMLLVILLIQLLGRAYFLTLGALRIPSWPAALAQSVRMLPRLVGVWIGVGLASCLWLPLMVFVIGFVATPVLGFVFPALIPVIILLPRFALAPTILAQEGISIIASLHESYRRTRGRWWDVMWQLLGVGATVWLVTSILQSLLDALVSSLLPYSLFGLSLYALGPFIALIGMGYRTFFMVELKEEVDRSQVATPLAAR